MWLLALVACAGVTVQVSNHTPQPLDEVTVEVTGARYALGTIAPGAEASVRVSPTGESSVVVSAIRAGTPAVVEVPVYFEAAHYKGTVSVDFQPGGVETRDDIELGYF